MGTVIERTPFTRDEPIDLGEDAFAHRDYTDTLLSIVGDESPPPTIGLFGRWGVGKSTIIGGLQKGLEGGDAAFVYFDAWRYDGDPLRRQFLIEAAHQLKIDGELDCGYKPAVELDELHVDKQEIRESLGVSVSRFIRAAAIGLAFALIAAVLLYFDVFAKVLEGDFGTEVLATVVAFVVGTFAGLFSQAIVVRPTTISHNALQDPDRFAEKFADLLKALKPQRLVVAIDNLDRCSPENAVEMLGTIKTYLEPTVAGNSPPRSSARANVDKEVVFVVSVDDQALRRHLLTQEASRSGDEDAFELGRYVDEYLAKFFSARVPIRTILPDDMRGYIAAHLKPLVKARRLEKRDEQELISVVAVGLRHNPRAVKQFSNDLESRLRLLEERERSVDGRSPGISPAVSGEVRMVAKLALIESEWPGAFERLVVEPRLLARWEEEAESREEVNWEGDGEERADGQREGAEAKDRHQSRRDFAAFLRQARSIQSQQLAAILRLKQPEKEVTPGYGEFRQALISSDRVGVEASLEAQEDKAELVEQLVQILDEEVRDAFWVNARAVIDAAVSVPALQPFEDARREVLTRAARNPRLRHELGFLDPSAVLDGAGVSEADRAHLIEPFVDRLADRDLEAESRRAVADAIAGVASKLSVQQAETVREAIAADLSDFPLYRKLAEAEPSLLPNGVADAALEALSAPVDSVDDPSQSQQSLLGAPNARALAVIVLEVNSDPEVEGRALQLVGSVLTTHVESTGFSAELQAAAELLRPIVGLAEPPWSDFLQGVAERWSRHQREAMPALLAFVAGFLERAAPQVRESLPGQVAAALFEDPERGIAVSAELDPVPAAFREALADQLGRVAAEHPSYSKAATDMLLRVGGDGTDTRLAQAVVLMIAANHTEQARETLRRQAETLDPNLAEIANGAVSHLVERINANEALDGELLAILAPELSSDAEATLASAMVAQLQAGAGEPVLSAIDHLRRAGGDVFAAGFAARALDGLAALGEIGPPNDALLAAVCRNVGLLDAEQQGRLVEKLSAWLSVQLGQATLLAGNIATIEGLNADPSKDLVAALVSAERALAPDQHEIRHQLLAAAYAIRGNKRTRSRRALRKRIEELREGSEFERELANRFRDVGD
jgi:hypothetical protein